MFSKNSLSMRKRNAFATIILILGVAFIMIGVGNGESKIVLQKAIMICLECIGIG